MYWLQSSVKGPTITLNPLPFPTPSLPSLPTPTIQAIQTILLSPTPFPFLPPNVPTHSHHTGNPADYGSELVLVNVSLLCYAIIVVRKLSNILVKRLRKWYDFNDFKLFFRYTRKIW